MAFDRENSLLFIHIPKNAGRSVEVAMGVVSEQEAIKYKFRSVANRLGTLLQRTTRDRIAGKRLWGTIDRSFCSQHLTYLEIKSLNFLEPRDLKDAYKFAIVRNPFARAVSTFRHFCPRQESALEFEAFWEGISSEVGLDHNRIAHIRPQADYILDSRGRIAMDQLFYFETLQQDFEALHERFPHLRKLPHVGNDGRALRWRDFYSDRSIKLIENYFDCDFELFGYPRWS